MSSTKPRVIDVLPAPLAGYVMVMDDAMSKHHTTSTEARAWAHIRQELFRHNAKTENSPVGMEHAP